MRRSVGNGALCIQDRRGRSQLQCLSREERFRLLHLERKGSGYYTYRGKVQAITLTEERFRLRHLERKGLGCDTLNFCIFYFITPYLVAPQYDWYTCHQYFVWLRLCHVSRQKPPKSFDGYYVSTWHFANQTRVAEGISIWKSLNKRLLFSFRLWLHFLFLSLLFTFATVCQTELIL